MGAKLIRGELVEMPINAVMGAEFIDPDEFSYERFLERKRFTPIVSGLTSVPELNPMFFPHQKGRNIMGITSWKGSGLSRHRTWKIWNRVRIFKDYIGTY